VQNEWLAMCDNEKKSGQEIDLPPSDSDDELDEPFVNSNRINRLRLQDSDEDDDEDEDEEDDDEGGEEEEESEEEEPEESEESEEE
jgi:hypothetical protein